jgi:hypothetical protein
MRSRLHRGNLRFSNHRDNLRFSNHRSNQRLSNHRSNLMRKFKNHSTLSLRENLKEGS